LVQLFLGPPTYAPLRRKAEVIGNRNKHSGQPRGRQSMRDPHDFPMMLLVPVSQRQGVVRNKSIVTGDGRA